MRNISFQKKIKGEYGYLNYQHFFSTLKTVLMFGLALLIFGAGYLYYGNKENIVTVLSVLTLLPSCHMLVICIMYWRFSTRSEVTYKKVSDIISKDTPVFFDSVLTIEKGGAYPMNVFACVDGCLIGYSDFEKCDAALLEKHLRIMLKNNHIEGANAKIYTDEGSFIKRLRDLVDKEEALSKEEKDRDIEAIALVGAISL